MKIKQHLLVGKKNEKHGESLGPVTFVCPTTCLQATQFSISNIKQIYIYI